MGILDGRVAICTGSGRGVGAEVAKPMAKEGASIIVNDPGVGGGEGGEQGPAETIANEIKAGGGKAAPNFGSVSSYKDCLGMVQQARDEFDGCHIVFNPAGILRDRMFHKMSPDDWQAVMDVHLNGHFNTARAAINLFREQEYGRIIGGSTSGLLGNIGHAVSRCRQTRHRRPFAHCRHGKHLEECDQQCDLSLGRHTNDPFGADTEGPRCGRSARRAPAP